MSYDRTYKTRIVVGGKDECQELIKEIFSYFKAVGNG